MKKLSVEVCWLKYFGTVPVVYWVMAVHAGTQLTCTIYKIEGQSYESS
jgi:hypothetical protein